MGSSIKHRLQKAIAVILAVCLTCTYTPFAYAAPGDAAQQQQDVQLKVNAETVAQEQVTSETAGAKTSISVRTYSNEIQAWFKQADTTHPYKTAQLIVGNEGVGITFDAEAFGGNGYETLDFAWSYGYETDASGEVVKIPLQNTGDFNPSSATERNAETGHAVSSVNLGVMARAGMFEDNKTYKFFCTVTSPKPVASGYSYDPKTIGPLVLSIEDNGNFPYQTIYADGNDTKFYNIDESGAMVGDFQIDAAKASSMASASGSIRIPSVLEASTLDSTSGAYAAMQDALDSASTVMAGATSIAFASDSNLTDAVAGSLLLTLPLGQIPENAKCEAGAQIDIISYVNGVASKLTDVYGNPVKGEVVVDGAYRYVKFTASTFGAFAAALPVKTAAAKFTVSASVRSTAGESGVGGTVEPAPSANAHEYAVGNTATYRIFEDTSNRYMTEEVRVSVSGGPTFVHKAGTTTISGNASASSAEIEGQLATYGIAFGGNFVTFSPDKARAFKLEAVFAQAPEITEPDPENPDNPVAEAAEVSARVVSGNGTVTVNGYAPAASGKVEELNDLHEGDALTVQITAAEGYSIEALTVNGEVISGEGNFYTFTAKPNSNTVEVAFKQGGTTPVSKIFNIYAEVGGDTSPIEAFGGPYPVKAYKQASASVSFGVKDAYKSTHCIAKIEDFITNEHGVILDPDNPIKTVEYSTDAESARTTASYDVQNVIAHHKIVVTYGEVKGLKDVNVQVIGAGSVIAKSKDGARTIQNTGTGTVTEVLKLRDGDSIQFSFEGGSDVSGKLYELSSIADTANAGATPQNNSYTMQGMSVNRSLVVVFTPSAVQPTPGEDPVFYTVSLSTNTTRGTITPENITRLPRGASERFYFNAKEGYALDKVYVNGDASLTEAIKAADNSYYLANISQNIDIRAEWTYVGGAEPDVCVNVTSKQVEGGYVEPDSASVRKGGNLNITLYALENYELTSVKANGASVGFHALAKGTWAASLVGIEQDTFIEAEFTWTGATPEKPIYHEVTANVVSGNGTVTPVSQSVKHGSNADFIINPDEGYKIDSIKVDGVAVQGDAIKNNYFTLMAVEEPHTITVEFKQTGGGAGHIGEDELVNVFTIANAGGVILPQNPKVAKGANKTFRIEPSQGYALKSLSVAENAASGSFKEISASELASVKSSGTYMLTKIGANGSDWAIKAEFVTESSLPTDPDTFSLTVNTPLHGTLKITDEGGHEFSDTSAVLKNTVVQVTATPASGYKVKSVTAMAGSVPVQLTGTNPYTFTLTANTTISAEFEPISVTPDPENVDLGVRTYDTHVGKSVNLKTDVPGDSGISGTVKWTKTINGTTEELAIAEGKSEIQETFTTAGAYTYTAYVQNGQKKVFQTIVVNVTSNTSGGTTITEPEVPVDPLPGGGEGGGDIPGSPEDPNGPLQPPKPEDFGKTENDVEKTEWFVSIRTDTSGQPIWTKISESDGFDHAAWAAHNLPDGTYKFKCELTFKDGDKAVKIYEVTIGNPGQVKDPGAGIPEVNPPTNRPHPEVVKPGVEGGGTITPPDGFDPNKDKIDWWGKDPDTGEWSHIPVTDPNSPFFGIEVDDKGNLVIPDPNNMEEGKDYQFEAIITHPDDTTEKEVVNTVVDNSGPGSKVPGTTTKTEIASDEGILLVPDTGVIGEGPRDWYVSPDGGKTWIALPTAGKNDPSSPYYNIDRDADGNLLIKSPNNLATDTEYDFRVVGKDSSGKDVGRQDFILNKKGETSDPNIPGERPGTGGSIIQVPETPGGGTGNGGVVKPVKPGEPGSTTEWFVKVGDSWIALEGSDDLREAKLDLAPGNYTVLVVTKTSDGNVYREFFEINIPNSSNNVASGHLPDGLVDVDVTVSVDVSVVSSEGATSATLTSVPRGSVTPNGLFKAYYGEDIRFYAFPEEGYFAEYALVNGTRYEVSPFKENAGFDLGRALGITGHADASTYYNCYTFNVPVDAASVVDNKVNIFVKFTNIEGDYTLEKVDLYNLNMTADRGLIHPIGENLMPKGGELSVLAYPVVKGMPLEHMTVSGEKVDPEAKSNGTYRHKLKLTDEVAAKALSTYGASAYAAKPDVLATIPVHASFASSNAYTLSGSVTPEGAGTISPQNASVREGESQTFTMRAADGYTLFHVLIDGVVQNATSTTDGAWIYTFANVNENHTIVAVFAQAQDTYLISARVEGGNGSVSPLEAEVLAGGSQTFTFTAEPGYEVASVSVDGADGAAYARAQSYTFNDVMSNHELVVTFQPIQIGGGSMAKTLRTLQSLAQTGDLNAPLALVLLTIGCGALGVAILVSGRRRKTSVGAHAEK